MPRQSTLELLEVTDVGPGSVSVRSTDFEPMVIARDTLGHGYHDAVLLAFRTVGVRSSPPRTRPITLKAIVDRDRESNSVVIHCVGIDLGIG